MVYVARRCATCKSRRYRKKNPIRYAYRALKDHAKARGIPFTITLEYFRKFALASDYLNQKGLAGHCLTVDRKNNLRGYVKGNIQPLTKSANCIKRAKHDEIRMGAGYAWRDKQENETDNKD